MVKIIVDMIDRPENINVFLLYAEEDVALKQDLETHLSLLSQKGYIDLWHEGKIVFNKNYDEVISNYLEQSQIILLLVSANFLAPDCYGKYEKDLNAAYLRQQKGKAQIIPVILRPCLWQLDFLATLSPLPSSGHPVRSRHWESQDLAFENIVMGILNIVDELKKDKRKSQPPPLPSANKNTDSDRLQEEPALQLINQLFKIIKNTNPVSGAQAVQAILHRSLIKEGSLELNFKKYKFEKAYEKIDQYKFPVVIKKKKNSGRKTIGVLLNKENGTEWIYTLEKKEDLGGITGQVRIFFSEHDGIPKVSSINL